MEDQSSKENSVTDALSAAIDTVKPFSMARSAIRSNQEAAGRTGAAAGAS